MNKIVKRIDTNELRVNLTKYLTKNLGDKIYNKRKIYFPDVLKTLEKSKLNNLKV